MVLDLAFVLGGGAFMAFAVGYVRFCDRVIGTER